MPRSVSIRPAVRAGADSRNDGGGRPRFVAYVYPGWHDDPFRPGVDEWDLVESFHPYFKGHERPPRPAGGRYDDSRVETAAAQIALAASYGIEAFTYFTYYGRQGFVLGAPMNAAVEAAESEAGFGVGATWCIRLPHDSFPVEHDEARYAPAADAETTAARDSGSLEDLPIEETTLRDLERLLGAASASELRLGSTGAPWLMPSARLPAPTADSGPQPPEQT